jgi:Chaperone of endosialidase
MNARNLISMASVVALVSLASQIEIHAQNLSPWPYSETCNSSTGACFVITNSNAAGIGLAGETAATGIAYSAVVGNATSTANGVAGGSNGGNGVLGSSAHGNGVFGQSVSGAGVYGLTTTGNAVLGQNSDTTNSAAAISAVPGSSAGLAYYGGGNIFITGSTAWKTGGGSWTAISDRRVKKDVADFKEGLSQLLRVRPVQFKYNGLGGTSDDGKQFVGVVAQELEKILPEMVSSRKAKLHPTDSQDTVIEQVDPSNFAYLLINAVQEQQKIIEHQEARLAALEQGKAPLASSIWSASGLSTAAGFGLLPVGLVLAVRKRRKDKK